MPPLAAVCALLVALVGLVLAWLVYGRQPAAARRRSADPVAERDARRCLQRRWRKAWWVDEFYQQSIVRGYQALSDFLADPVDQGLIDGIVNGFGYLSRRLCPGAAPACRPVLSARTR